MKTYNRGPCRVCGKDVSCAGFAQTAHMRKHVREGLAIEEETGHWLKGRFEVFRRFVLTPAGVEASRRTRERLRARRDERVG